MHLLEHSLSPNQVISMVPSIPACRIIKLSLIFVLAQATVLNTHQATQTVAPNHSPCCNLIKHCAALNSMSFIAHWHDNGQKN